MDLLAGFQLNVMDCACCVLEVYPYKDGRYAASGSIWEKKSSTREEIGFSIFCVRFAAHLDVLSRVFLKQTMPKPYGGYRFMLVDCIFNAHDSITGQQ